MGKVCLSHQKKLQNLTNDKPKHSKPTINPLEDQSNNLFGQDHIPSINQITLLFQSKNP